MSTNKNRSLKQRFPTLLTGLAVLLITAGLLSGRALLLNAQGKDAGPAQSRQTANVNLADVITADNQNTGAEQGTAATVQDGVQYITSTVSSRQYEPITVQQGIPVKWTLNVPSGALNGCNNSITIPKYNLEVELKTGENVIEFTPDESGTFPFSCWMGMIRSSITVVSDDGTVADNPDDGSNALPAGCCGGQR
ncbi:cupredoxin domain-containing protein [Faecalicatena contorta]|uniref:EfeO-type cupredoxin-like domain-containing protein n=1 Tax=Faecalicatena contorta TaxID=39482 RepID=A0A315ZU82_9FIRM|nr:hypothetical protein [Faecalicatena contorta]PWJ48899.1 hypothetical protein A8805_10940 [Faecalicatena contorta]SUQ14989.1 hypothetical protein SAMN05216529_10940 [Faecalicatena contorta]